MIELRSVSRSVGSSPVHNIFSELDFSCPAGKLVALVGPSGCGKSSLVELLSLDRRPDSGEVWVNGVEVSFSDAAQLASLRSGVIGYLHQSPMLFEQLTIRKNLELAMSYCTLTNKLAMRNVENVLSLLGVHQLLDAFPSAISGGERQRVCLARSVAKNPKVLVCDEPTAALDRKSAEKVMKLLNQLATTGSAVVVATHDPFVMRESDATVEMSGGALA